MLDNCKIENFSKYHSKYHYVAQEYDRLNFKRKWTDIKIKKWLLNHTNIFFILVREK